MDWLILTLSLVAGVVGTGLGGVIGALLKARGARVMGKVLGFAGGVMMGVVAFEMLPEAIASTAIISKAGGIAIAVATTVGGMAVVFAVNKLLDFIERKKNTDGVSRSDDVNRTQSSKRSNDAFRASAMVFANARYSNTINVADSAVSGIKNSLNKYFDDKNRQLCKNNKFKESAVLSSKTENRKRELIKAGTVMLIAIALHNFPEGMAIGASGSLETQMGILIAVIIAVHNIPEGMAISAPLVSGGVHGGKAILLTALAGGATVIGAVLGLALGGLGELATGICLSLASGAMLYVTFCDILPQSIALCDGDVPSISMLAGLVFSIIFVFAF